jgi:hypothetical protein
MTDQDIEVATRIFHRYGDGAKSIDSVAFSLQRWLGWSHDKAVHILQQIVKTKND